ncbi:MAG: MotA/TolQ/ExbB proton channel family protein [Ignavibacteriales bacterium]|nr:MotA/TolQ/ExbB proton channel family protein [Ignavibacteriaceae bacterium]NLH61137.1 MotA/TolQ/ExbB proton channel family protein [Ignavibacteriales bacterium]HOJ18959.1 MotA/TolQ/ExbB proton channel family protein [Ignavibacteriaceae bacterium]HPO56463.1 MotA/TolQ/ExbB proton channel family protein [Ignavibacteriaceae bacterium]
MHSLILLFQENQQVGGSWWRDNWLISIIFKGGVEIMGPLFIFSIIVLAVLLERLYKYYTIPNEAKSNKILEDINENIKKFADIDKVVEYIKTNKTIFSYIFIRVIQRYKFLVGEKRPILDMRNELLDTSDISARDYLEEFLPVINTISSIATMLGLLGTILGMISSFDEIAKGGKGDPAVVAGGISIALLTTAGGLVVAIPAVLAYSFLKRRLEKIINQIAPFSNHFVNFLLKDLARLSTYKEMLLTAYRDGKLNKDEQLFLKEKRLELNISEEEFEKLAKEVLDETGHKVNLDKVGE